MSNVKQYALKNYFLNHNLDHSSIEINYGNDMPGKIRMVNNSDPFFRDQSNRLNENNLVWDHWYNEEIPFLFSSDKANEVISMNEDGSVTINYDIFGSIYYFLSGWQELDKVNADQYGRFPFENSLQNKLDIIEIPIVNYYYSILSKAICMAYGLEKVVQKFENKNFITFVSHDIDICQSGWLQDAFHQIKSKKFLSALNIIAKRPFRKDHWFNFNRILNFEKKRNISSTFFFIPSQETYPNVKENNADYNLNTKKFQNVFNHIKVHNSEVGLHGSLGSGLDKHHMNEDVNKFPSKIVGNRYHFLMYEIDRIPAILDHCSLSYDNSVYFAEHIGFRHSTCTPFFLYNFSTDQASKVIEIPLTIMDGTLKLKKYMSAPIDDILGVCKKTINEVHKFSGILSILWHNNYYSDYKFKDWDTILEQILDYVETLDTSYMNGEQIMDELNTI